MRRHPLHAGGFGPLLTRGFCRVSHPNLAAAQGFNQISVTGQVHGMQRGTIQGRVVTQFLVSANQGTTDAKGSVIGSNVSNTAPKRAIRDSSGKVIPPPPINMSQLNAGAVGPRGLGTSTMLQHVPYSKENYTVRVFGPGFADEVTKYVTDGSMVSVNGRLKMNMDGTTSYPYICVGERFGGRYTGATKKPFYFDKLLNTSPTELEAERRALPDKHQKKTASTATSENEISPVRHFIEVLSPRERRRR